MKCATRKMRSPLKWHGGKSYLARRIVALFPEHRVYVEPFFGGGSILLNKPKAEREIAGDLNGELINFWTVLQCTTFPVFPSLAAGLEYSEENFLKAKEAVETSNTGVQAIRFLVRNRFSRGGLGKDFAWSDRLRGGQPGDVNAWDTIRAELPAIAERVRDVEFGQLGARQLIPRVDAPDVLFYCDPPYLHETRTAKATYAHEMNRTDHEELLDALLRCKGKVFLSGYRSTLYDDALKGWTRHEFDMPNHSGQGKAKQRRVECLWESP